MNVLHSVVSVSDGFSHVADRSEDDSPGIRDYISDVVRRTVRETFGAYSREQARRERDRVDEFRSLLNIEITKAQVRFKIALDGQVDQKLNNCAKMHDSVTWEREIRRTRMCPAPNAQAKGEPTSIEEILPSYHSQKLTPYLDAQVIRPDRYLGSSVP